MAKVKKIIKTIKVDADLCNGCRGCEIACSNFHAEPKYSSVNPARSRIRVITHRLKDIWLPVFAGGYSAGYYSYIWSEVLDADAFAAFKENGLFDRKTAGSFRKNILERGGTADAMDLWMAFRGREPSVEPLLKRRGLK